MPRSILITKQITPESVLETFANHATVDYESSEIGLSSEQLVARAAGKDILITQITDRLSRPVIEQLRGPRLIAQIAVGYDNIDLQAATDHGILISNTPGVVTESTADHAFGLMLAAARRIPEAHNFIQAGQWERWTMGLMIGHDVHGQTLGILGLGRIGQAVARRARGFSMRILYHNRKPLDPALEKELGAQWVSKEELLREADFISLHVSLNDETRRSFGEAQLRAMKPSAILINTSRGPVVDEAALARALRERWIAGAGLDVFENEPAIHPDLVTCTNAVMVPHIASATIQTRVKMLNMAFANAIAFLEDRQPPNLLNPPKS